MAEKTPKLTGTQKKAIKQAGHEYRKAAPYRKEGIKKTESFLHGGRRYESTERKQKDYLKDLKKELGPKAYKDIERFLPGGKAYKGSEQFLGLMPFEYQGSAYQNPDFYKEGKEGYKMAQRVLEPIQQNAMRQYALETIPGVVNEFGRESKSSSALNQALAAAKQNLSSQLHAQTAGLAAQYGSDISRMNLGERARQQELQQGTALDRARLNIAQQAQQQGLQYGAASDIFGAKRGAALGLNEQQRSNLEYLNNLAMGSAYNLQNAGIAGSGAAFQPTRYSGGSNSVSPLVGGLTGGLGGAASGAAIGTALGGPGIGTAIGGGVGTLAGLLASR